MMETKDFKFRIDDVNDDEGTFTGFASVFGEVDSYNEVVDKGAFRKTLKENDGKFPLCWFHNVTQPLGIIYAKEKNQGLDIKGGLNLDVQSAKEKRSLMKQGAIKGLSIGFRTVKDTWDDQVRHLKEVKLFEISAITLNFQACPGAEIGDIKAKDRMCLRSTTGGSCRKPITLEEILDRILSIDVVENLSSERLELIIKSITHLKTLQKEGEPLVIGTLGPMEPSKGLIAPIYEVLEKRRSKPQPHLLDSILKTLENLT